MHNYVVSDIHGNAERLNELLSVLSKKHPQKDFNLYILGDLFDRGFDSEEVLSLITKNFKNIKVLLGNHEDLFMRFMQNPELNYIQWQGNFAYSTMGSFAYKISKQLLDEYKNKSDRTIMLDFKTKYYETYKKLADRFNGFSGSHAPETYINEMINTQSSRDNRSFSKLISGFYKSAMPKKTVKTRYTLEQLTYLYLLDEFCDVYDYFETLEPYEIIDNKFLLVHSGYVSQNRDPKILDSVADCNYNICESVNDLTFQNVYPMLWSRRRDKTTGKAVPPQERFDDKVVIFGHTTTDNFNKDASMEAIYTYNKFGELASIGIDGLNWHTEFGQLNCINLDDLSQIIIKGSNMPLSKRKLSVIHKQQFPQPPQPS